ncbi:MAG TPA: DUF4349 domain-containing protein [Solirubrobacteraceae bacterium]|nr:DUF4349 domain-containing protein [Solirubrobacteraceae bacterium]
MRSADPLEPEVLAALEAIDATLHGEPVDPEHADLAELALILRDERPAPRPTFLADLDRRAAHRFAEPRASGRGRRAAGGWADGWSGWRTWVTAATALAAVCIALVMVVRPHGSGSSGASVNGRALSTSTNGSSASGAASSGAAGSAASAPGVSSGAHGTSSRSSAAAGASTANRTATSPRAPAPPHPAGRDITQSARVGLEAQAGRIALVAQEVFELIGSEHGTVLSSHVTQSAGAPGFASFTLQVAAGRLQTTLDRLSRLRHARVTTREDASADITSHVDNTAAALAGAQARRRSLLRQLAATAVPAQADRLQREAARALAEIDRYEAELQRLRHSVADSTIAVSVQSPPVIAHHHRAYGGFTFGSAMHDAGRILLVAAGVSLIALAVLVPLGLVVAVCAWVWSLVLRRRREGALGPS